MYAAEIKEQPQNIITQLKIQYNGLKIPESILQESISLKVGIPRPQPNQITNHKIHT